MGASCAATAIAGRWSDFSRGCITSVGSSPDGNTTLKTSSASFTSDAFSCCSNIYETASSVAMRRARQSLSEADEMRKFVAEAHAQRKDVVMSKNSNVTQMF